MQRVKEDAHDYRYFPEPDLMPVDITREWIDEIAADLPEAPQDRRDRFVDAYGITDYDAGVLTADRALADYYEAAAACCADPKLTANWVMTELLRALGERGVSVAESPIPATSLAELLCLIDDKTISGKIAKVVFAEMLDSGKAPKAIVEEKGLVQVTDAAAIETFVQQAIDGNPGPVEEYRGGKAKALQYLVGQVMKSSRGKANPQLVVQMLKQKLD